jgi:hypothetical protein
MVLTRNVFNEANSVPFEQKQIMFKLEYTKLKIIIIKKKKKKNFLLKEIKADGKM